MAGAGAEAEAEAGEGAAALVSGALAGPLSGSGSESSAAGARRLLALRELERRACRTDPARLFSWCEAPDTRDTARRPRFSFAHCRDERAASASGWGWQRALFLWLYGTQRSITLKARQLGLSWIACGAVLVDLLLYPGSLCLVFRQKERDAWDNVERVWQLFCSLPEWLRFGAVVEKPSRVEHPSPTAELRLRFPDGRSSTVRGMSSGATEGHGSVVRRALMDEFAHMENAADVMTGVGPALGSVGHLMVVSTAHGVSDPETGEGNHFHWLWQGSQHGAGVSPSPVRGVWRQAARGENGFEPVFLGWDAHPERNQEWYESDPEVRSLPAHKRSEQFPATPTEGFQLSNRVFFDPDDLAWYGRWRRSEPLFSGVFAVERQAAGTTARLERRSDGYLTVFALPEARQDYALAVDVSSGRGVDYSAGYVVSLQTMQLVCELHGRLSSDLLAEQLHFLGRWYGEASGCERDALVAVEVGGGWGDAVIVSLRDGVAGRPAYRRLYRHRLAARPDPLEQKPFGFPTNMKTRPLIVAGLERAVRERVVPALPGGLLMEMATFVRHDSGVSPAAQSGCRDDRVMAACIALELYRQRGEQPLRPRRENRRRSRPAHPWTRAPREAPRRALDGRDV